MRTNLMFHVVLQIIVPYVFVVFHMFLALHFYLPDRCVFLLQRMQSYFIENSLNLLIFLVLRSASRGFTPFRLRRIFRTAFVVVQDAFVTHLLYAKLLL